MTEEEKEAIEILETLSCYGLGLVITDENIQAIDIVLDYIEKLQKENKELKEENTILEGNKIGLKLAIQELKEKIENEIKELEENEDFYREQGRMYEYEGKINLLKRLLAKE